MRLSLEAVVAVLKVACDDLVLAPIPEGYSQKQLDRLCMDMGKVLLQSRELVNLLKYENE